MKVIFSVSARIISRPCFSIDINDSSFVKNELSNGISDFITDVSRNSLFIDIIKIVKTGVNMVRASN